MSQILSLRAEVQKLVEKARAEKHIKTSSQVEVYLTGILGSKDSESLSALLGVSAVNLMGIPSTSALEWNYESSLELDNGPIGIALGPATHSQCPRCWLYKAEKEDSLCTRCDQVTQAT
ncbi:hypothetical protein I302_106958 [Kwoniella bestiolae CBS 10118]|uniref:Uncharacterized protein n=1 Tax=Kwoniella bestiolae CBS 10118 TaxID=1296100 RepID=A0AAJ8KCN2_9TREE